MTALAAIDGPEGPRTLIDDLLEEQQQLTAVDRFARRYESGDVHAQAQYYRDLIPLSRPGRGEQYAFAVDLDACTGCKACVSACHSLNGLEEDEIWRNVGLLHGGGPGSSYQQTVTTACHHCVEPGCLLGCPVMAYEKDVETGIVRHLDDQCIGCQYCILKCPYDVPKYSPKKGIVRKCDMCSSRLAVGEAPACVQACPTSAIRIELVDVPALTARLRPGTALLPGAFDSSYTKPTTRYRSEKFMPRNARAGDAETLRLEHAHWPLILMLVLTQASVGLSLVLAVVASASGTRFPGLQALVAVSAFGILQLALGVSVLHLGRPLGAWRFFLGLGTSWMSREILAFSILAAAAGTSAALATMNWLGVLNDMPILQAVQVLVAPSAWLAGLCGLAGVYCSAMIYIDTHRPFWAATRTFPKFFGGTLLLGASTATCLFATASLVLPVPASAAFGTGLLTLLVRGALFLFELADFRRTRRDDAEPNHRSVRTIWTLRRPCAQAYAALFILGTSISALGLTQVGWSAALCAALALALTGGAQLIERYLYFVAVVAPRMPGALSV